VDAGFLIRQLPTALVHHKFLPSEIRNEYRVTRNRYAVLKNKIYFSLINNRGHYGLDQAIRDAVIFVDDHERDIRHHVEQGAATGDLSTFQSDVERAWNMGLNADQAESDAYYVRRQRNVMLLTSWNIPALPEWRPTSLCLP
jgi:hypothetical protein